MSPIPDELHPAISHRGLDYVGLSTGLPRLLALGVVQAAKEETPYLLLLRALNCFAELSPPLRVTQLGRELPCEALPEDLQFGLHLCVTERQSAAPWQALVELSRDMAELFVRQVAEYPQFEGILGRVGCLEIAPAGASHVVTMQPIWLV